MQDYEQYQRPVAELARQQAAAERVLLEGPPQAARYWALALAALMLAFSVYLFLNTSQLFERFQGRLAGVEDRDATRIRLYNEKLEALQNRMTVFVADSVETKLKTLEQNVALGSVGAQEIKTLEELKGEVKLLETYSAGKRANLTDPARLDHPRFQTTPGSEAAAGSGELLYEVTQMKRLLYLGIASCGFVGCMIGGYWWRITGRARRLGGAARTPLLVRQMGEDL